MCENCPLMLQFNLITFYAMNCAYFGWGFLSLRDIKEYLYSDRVLRTLIHMKN